MSCMFKNLLLRRTTYLEVRRTRTYLGYLVSRLPRISATEVAEVGAWHDYIEYALVHLKTLSGDMATALDG